MIKYYLLKDPSQSSFTKWLILLMQNYTSPNCSASAFILCSWVGAVISPDNSNNYKCCIASSIYGFPAHKLTAITLSSLPRYTSIMIPSFHCAFFRSSFFITTTSPTLKYCFLFLCYKLCPTRNEVKHSFLHLFHAASLHFCIYFCLFCKYSFSISIGSSLGIAT